VKKVDFTGEVPRSVEDVYAAFTSAGFWSSYAQENHLSPPQFDLTEENGGQVTRMRSTVAVNQPQARSFIGDNAAVTATTRWSPRPAPYQGDLGVDVNAKAKADLAGTLRLEAAGESSTRLTFNGTLNVRIPFVGGMVEGQALKYVPQAFDNLSRKLSSWQPAA